MWRYPQLILQVPCSVPRLSRLKPPEHLCWKKQEGFRGVRGFLCPLGVTFVFVPLCDPLFFFEVVIVFFVLDLSFFFPDPYSVVSGNAVVVPGALKESTQLRK